MPNISKLLCNALVALSILSATPVSADEPVIPADKFVYCTVCHGAQMRGNVLLKAPRVSEMEAWYVKRQMEAFSNGWRGDHGEDIAGMEMRPMAAILTSDEIDEVASYVSRVSSDLPAATVAGDVAKGANLYTSCAVCHGTTGEGNEGLRTPSLAGRNDWYLATQLRNFRSGIRGSHPADTYGVQMRAATGVLTDDEAINNVVAYLNTLKPE